MKDAEDVMSLYDLLCRITPDKREGLERYLKIKQSHDETKEGAPWIWDDHDPAVESIEEDEDSDHGISSMSDL